MVLIVVVMVVTCPDKYDHQQAVRHVVTNVVDETIEDNVPDDIPFVGLAGSVVASKLVETFLDSRLEVTNYYVLSVGRVDFNGRQRLVSVGAFGHIFTFDEEDVKQAIKDKLADF